MAENLVFVGKIIALDLIPNADLISSATVVCGSGGKWRGVVRKKDLAIGDKCIVYLPDSLLPQHPDMQFMANTKWRVKMRTFKGSPSEVLIMPPTPDLPDVGTDITDLIKVTKYIKPVPAHLAGIAKGSFPSFIPKTDEPNFQRSQDLIELLKGNPYYITEKADGSSTTAYRYKGNFGVCSRNLELEESAENGYWEIANRYNLREKLPEGFAIQWETCGPKIQKNPMGLSKIEAFAFSVFDIENQLYLTLPDYFDFCKKLGFPMVPLLRVHESFEPEDLSELAKGNYANGHAREGIVIRSKWHIYGKIISFKAINLDYDD